MDSEERENPYAAPASSLREPAARAPGFEPASFGARGAALLLDNILIALVSLPILVATYGWEYLEGDMFELFGIVDVLVSYGLPIAYHVGGWVFFETTFGKRALRLRVVTAGLEPLGVGQAILRYFAYIPSALALGLGYLAMLWDREGRTWHDRLSGSRVIWRG